MWTIRRRIIGRQSQTSAIGLRLLNDFMWTRLFPINADCRRHLQLLNDFMWTRFSRSVADRLHKNLAHVCDCLPLLNDFMWTRLYAPKSVFSSYLRSNIRSTDLVKIHCCNSMLQSRLKIVEWMDLRSSYITQFSNNDLLTHQYPTMYSRCPGNPMY